MRRLLRFSVVGVINTVVDIAAFLILTNAEVGLFLATLLSTSLGVITGLILHHKFTFGADSATRHHRILYIVVTLIGLWIIQPPIVWAVHALAAHAINDTLALLSAKLTATAITFGWNYIWYDRVIFAVKNTERTYVAVSQLHHR